MIRSSKGNTIQCKIEDVMAQMLATGEICLAGQNAAGEDLLMPSAKAVVRATCEHLQDALNQADCLQRNFTYTEQRDLLIHVRQLYQALAASEEQEA
jgi:hypothetical protein